MNSLSKLFNFTNPGSVQHDEMPDIFPLDINKIDFIKTDIVTIYSKILIDVFERTGGLSEDQQDLLFDNCLQSESAEGLITMLAAGMADKKDLFIKYDQALQLVRPAVAAEISKIREDYLKFNESSEGVFISFKKFIRSDMVKMYSALEYCAIAALNKDINLASAIQIKIKDLRGSVALTDSADVKSQATSIATGLSKGKDVLIDAGDTILTSIPNLTAIKEGINFLNEKRSFYLGLPKSYILGEQTGGIGSTGEGDTKAIERGLKNYYFSIVKPVIKALLGIETSYKSQDFRMLTQGFAALQSFSLDDTGIIDDDEKRRIVRALFDLSDEAAE